MTIPEAQREWIEKGNSGKAVIAVLPDGEQIRLPYADPTHTTATVNQCEQAVGEAIARAGGTGWCVSRGCKCLIPDGSWIGTDGEFRPIAGVMIDNLRWAQGRAYGRLDAR